MCESCERLGVLVEQIAAGTRKVDGEVLVTMLRQSQMSLQHMLEQAQVSVGDFPRYGELAASAMSRVGLALMVNAGTIAHAARTERERRAGSN